MQSRKSNLLRLTWGCAEWQLRHRVKYEKQIYRLTAAIGTITIIYVKIPAILWLYRYYQFFPDSHYTAQ